MSDKSGSMLGTAVRDKEGRCHLSPSESAKNCRSAVPSTVSTKGESHDSSSGGPYSGRTESVAIPAKVLRLVGMADTATTRVAIEVAVSGGKRRTATSIRHTHTSYDPVDHWYGGSCSSGGDTRSCDRPGCGVHKTATTSWSRHGRAPYRTV